MATPRWTAKVYTRVAGNPIAAASENTLGDRVVTLAADIGGNPAADYNGPEADLIDALNAQLLFRPLPCTLGPHNFRPLNPTLALGTGYTDVAVSAFGLFATYPTTELYCPIDLPVGTVMANGMKFYANLVHASASVYVRVGRYNPSTTVNNAALFSGTTPASTGELAVTMSGGPQTVEAGFYYYAYALLTNNSAPSEALFRGIDII